MEDLEQFKDKCRKSGFFDSEEAIDRHVDYCKQFASDFSGYNVTIEQGAEKLKSDPLVAVDLIAHEPTFDLEKSLMEVRNEPNRTAPAQD